MAAAVSPGGALPAWFVGRFEISTESGMADVRRAIESVSTDADLAQTGVPVALVTVKPDAPTWKYQEVPPGGTAIVVHCAFCRSLDVLPVDFHKWSGSRWWVTAEKPVNVEPSILITVGVVGTPGSQRCHYFIHGGQFQLLGDSQPWKTS